MESPLPTNKGKKPAGDMTLLEHIKDFRFRIISSVVAIFIFSVVAYIFYQDLILILFKPFEILEGSIGTNNSLFISTLFEGFVTKIKLSFFAGIIFSFPVHLYNFIRFIFPALKYSEKKVIIIALATSLLLVFFSFYYSYANLIPISVRFLTSSGFIPSKVGVILNFEKNVFYILQFIFISLIVFQFPIILELLLMVNLLKRKSLLRMSRFIMVGIFILSALLTPPDFVSQVGLSLPLILLFFLTIFIAKIFKFGEGDV
jgi:sec-independent protein translocase protein TatC